MSVYWDDPDRFYHMRFDKKLQALCYVTDGVVNSPNDKVTSTNSEDDHWHKFSLDPHGHAIEYGIFQGLTANSMQISVDGTLIGTYGRSLDNFNLITKMTKDANGNISRGKHKITITPDTMSRIECSFQIRLFTNSLGGGQY